MSLLEVTNLNFKYQLEELYKEAEMRLFLGDHAVLVGPNGAGKSTLLKLINKDLSPDKGKVEWQAHIKVGYLDQYATIDPQIQVKTYLYDVFLPLFEKELEQQKVYEKIALIQDEKEQDRLLHYAMSITEELENKNFYSIASQIGNVINGLGLSQEILEYKIKELSGGMRAKVILGKLLLGESDVLLLDEPTNFLDVKHIEWLEKFLNNYEKTFLVVSHDEGFLANIAKTVYAVENGKISRYKGDYYYYLEERELRMSQQQKAFESQNKFIEKTEDFIKKNITRASTTKRAQSRRKMLEKIPRLTKPKVNKKLHFKFDFSVPTGQEVLKITDLEIGYNSEALLAPINFEVRKNDKVVITGKNGIGKSTLLKTVLNIIPKISGTYHFIDTANIVYFEQDSHLDEKYTAFEHIHYQYPDYNKTQVMGLLAHYGIDYELATRHISTLSGGEKTKLRFALLQDTKSNVLILDEPTNHLDVDAKEALKEALLNYEGTLILVSHEKEFYQEICDYEISLYETA
ncbi:ABC-type transport system, ATPase component [Alteracholeplasma palmae J233]|uniref:ABC-type transport system, ATPase component n=1 Tax=Alteracholeplasma palmae (strain ATCC 49389 / J233) TaxID=1318466 RepID=U4KKV6_ALTPJ|nr:ABC-F family ATP-binding cassette domain-containing protein [Alteracholeplasma palmae]CCV64337.1 ABC-type transport system, ATPase component [Alteracholeplasma palmae J233]